MNQNKVYFCTRLERWQSGRLRRSWKPLYREVPGVRIPLSPLYGCSSVGRALVSKTRCRAFESLLPCQFPPPHFIHFFTVSSPFQGDPKAWFNYALHRQNRHVAGIYTNTIFNISINYNSPACLGSLFALRSSNSLYSPTAAERQKSLYCSRVRKALSKFQQVVANRPDQAS